MDFETNDQNIPFELCVTFGAKKAPLLILKYETIELTLGLFLISS